MAILPAAAALDPGFALVRGADQWVRASFADCALVGGAVQLAWEDAPEGGQAPGAAPPRGAGLAFDGQCRLYHSLPDAGSVERLPWAAQDALRPAQPGPAPTPLFAAVARTFGDFAPRQAALPLAAPRGLAVDAEDRLFVAAYGSRTLLVLEGVGERRGRRILRRAVFPGRPLDLATDPSGQGREVLVVTESPLALYRMTARGTPRPLQLPAGVQAPVRLAVSPAGARVLLSAAGSAAARVLELTAPQRDRAVPWATDIAFYSPNLTGQGDPNPDPDAAGGDEGAVLTVARRPGELFLRLRLTAVGLEELPGLAAPGYDGLGIVATPDQRIAFWSARGLRYAVAARRAYRRTGQVVGFRLDSGDFQTQWGRLFVDACIPRETDLRVHCIAADELPEVPLVQRLAPVNLRDPGTPLIPPHDALSPSLPAQAWVPDPGSAAGRLHRRAEGLELPWARRAPNDAFATYETPTTDRRGRYLWVILELSGNGRNSPRVRALRAGYPAHDLLARLPRVLGADADAERFLGRFLAPLAGLTGDLDARARLRHALLDPRSAPDEALPWLADFFGLVLDERWSAAVRRALIAEVIELFRYRGTIRGLKRFLHLVTGVEPIIIERYRMRGGAVIGEPTARGSRAVLGAGMRVGGQVGTSAQTPLGAGSAADAFETHAHRFTVMLPALLSEETLALAARVLEVHRPAHTLYDLCTVTAGSRVGRGLHVGLSAVIGRGSGWEPLRIGAGTLGRGGLLGQPAPGTRTDGARVGLDTRVG